MAAIVGNLPESIMGPGVYILDPILPPFFNQTMRQLVALNVGGFAGAAILPARLISWELALGCSGFYEVESIIVNLCNGPGF